MYTAYFGLSAPPFSISPDPRFLYLSDGHREALAHLLYGLGESGGFVQLTGAAGTGKTTLCRALLSSLPADVDAVLLVNPRVDPIELLESVCDELGIDYPPGAGVRELLGRLNRRLLDAHARGRRTVLIIDEAQILSPEVLEHVRLLTNLETERDKLLRIILVGQSELRRTLARNDLRQLAQRITARWHLEPLDREGTCAYIARRLLAAGCGRRLFSRAALRRIHRLSAGVPRLINVLCDRALLGAYARDRAIVSAAMVRHGAREVMGLRPFPQRRVAAALALLAALLVAVPLATWRMGWMPEAAAVRIDRIVYGLAGTDRPTLSDWRAGKDGAALLVRDAHGDDSTPVPDTAMRTDIPPSAASRAAMLGGPLLEAVMAGRLPTPSRVEALRRLVAIWDADPGLVVDCVSVGEVGLRCLQGIGDWDDLRRYDRPVAIELRRDDATSRFLVVRGLTPRTAEVELEGERRLLALEHIDRFWEGKFVLLWRPPPLLSFRIDRGSDSEDIRWLRRALNMASVLDGELPLADVDLPEFDDELLDRLHRFQYRNGLEQSDVAGEPELILINARLGLADIALLE